MELKTIARIAAARVAARPRPIAVAFELTHLCNLACHYCDRHTPLPNEMTREQILSALSDLYTMGMRYLSIDGGEPLAHKHVDEIVEHVTAMGVRAVMNTNGILVPKKLDTVRKLAKVKISLDGPAANHDLVRGKDAYRRAVRGADAAREAGVAVEFTCVVGTHNHAVIDELLDYVEERDYTIVFQPARDSLFLDTEDGSGTEYQLETERLRSCFSRIEERKMRNPKLVGNKWSSLRHFRSFPEDVDIPCSAGWVEVTMDPEGRLYHCGQINRADKSCSVVTLGVRGALDKLQLGGCKQCWCARVVEGNYTWGGRVGMMVPPLGALRGRARGR